MNILISIIIVVLIILLVLLSAYHVKVVFAFTSQQYTHFNFIISWLYPLIKGVITNKEDGSAVISIYFFNKKILTKDLRKNKKKKNKRLNFNLITNVKFKQIKLRTSYGFKNPAITGVVCGVINMIFAYVNAKDLYNNPDFSMNSSYINIAAETEINIFSTLMSILRLKISNLRAKTLLVNK